MSDLKELFTTALNERQERVNREMAALQEWHAAVKTADPLKVTVTIDDEDAPGEGYPEYEVEALTVAEAVNKALDMHVAAGGSLKALDAYGIDLTLETEYVHVTPDWDIVSEITSSVLAERKKS